MRTVETSKFRRLRKKIRSEPERDSLRKALAEVLKDPDAGKRLKGEFVPLRSFSYAVEGQPRRLIYRWEKDAVILYSFGPRQGIYK